jgi:hypothetical protein
MEIEATYKINLPDDLYGEDIEDTLKDMCPGKLVK